ncbi:MAG TPA: hypothetical protein VE130_10725 [Nitrososphaeraceae archaeon]|nr:hypothetical protein [Nitrososphaeraceae archaeon]
MSINIHLKTYEEKNKIMYPEKIKPENNSPPANEETIDTLVELTDSNHRNRISVKKI